jgi:hypothetical protein
LIDIHCFGHVVHKFEDGREVCGAIQLAIPNGILVAVKNALNAIALWVKDVAIYSETMVRLVSQWRHRSSKTKGRNLLIRVVVL